VEIRVEPPVWSLFPELRVGVVVVRAARVGDILGATTTVALLDRDRPEAPLGG